jgi:hypothetical protein
MLEDCPVFHAASCESKWDLFPCSHGFIDLLINLHLRRHFEDGFGIYFLGEPTERSLDVEENLKCRSLVTIFVRAG